MFLLLQGVRVSTKGLLPIHTQILYQACRYVAADGKVIVGFEPGVEVTLQVPHWEISIQPNGVISQREGEESVVYGLNAENCSAWLDREEREDDPLILQLTQYLSDVLLQLNKPTMEFYLEVVMTRCWETGDQLPHILWASQEELVAAAAKYLNTHRELVLDEGIDVLTLDELIPIIDFIKLCHVHGINFERCDELEHDVGHYWTQKTIDFLFYFTQILRTTRKTTMQTVKSGVAIPDEGREFYTKLRGIDTEKERGWPQIIKLAQLLNLEKRFSYIKSFKISEYKNEMPYVWQQDETGILHQVYL